METGTGIGVKGICQGHDGLTPQIFVPGHGEEVLLCPIGGVDGGNTNGVGAGQHQPAAIARQVADLDLIIAIADRNLHVPLPRQLVTAKLLQAMGGLVVEVNAGDIVEP